MYKMPIFLLIFLTSCSISTDYKSAYKAELIYLDKIFSKLNSEVNTDWYCLQYIDSSLNEIHSFFMIDRKDFHFAFKMSSFKDYIIYIHDISKPSEELSELISSDFIEIENTERKFKFSYKENGDIYVSELTINQILSCNTIVEYLFILESGFYPDVIYNRDEFFQEVIINKSYDNINPIYEKRY